MSRARVRRRTKNVVDRSTRMYAPLRMEENENENRFVMRIRVQAWNRASGRRLPPPLHRPSFRAEIARRLENHED